MGRKQKQREREKGSEEKKIEGEKSNNADVVTEWIARRGAGEGTMVTIMTVAVVVVVVMVIYRLSTVEGCAKAERTRITEEEEK